MSFVLNIIYFPSSVHTLPLSACSPYLVSTNIDIRSNNQHVQPCPASTPCQCICEVESKRLWIDCFNRQLTSLPLLKTIATNNTIIEWNIDLAFNLFENFTFDNRIKWIPNNILIRHMVLSSSLAYDLIVYLNLTHRHLIDIWPSQQHIPIIDDQYHLIDDYNNDRTYEEENDGIDEFDTTKRSTIPTNADHTRLLADLTLELRDKTKRIRSFTLPLSGEPAPILNLYLDHNSMDSIPIQALYNATSIYEIYLSFNNIDKILPYSFGFSHRLTRVDISYNKIKSIDRLAFQRHPDAFAGPFLIDYLDLSHNQIKHLEINVFSYLVNLRLLKLEHNQIRSISAHAWTGLYRLKYLDLSHNYLDNINQTFYSGYLNELNHLKITSNNLNYIGSCEFLSLKRLNKLNVNGNNITALNTCSFYGIQRKTTYTTLKVYLRSNQLETIDPCTFENFARSTIHLENNPLICNCSFNYLSHNRQSIAYTGQECRGGFSYQSENQQIALPAVRKSNLTSTKKTSLNISTICRDVYKYYDDLCVQIDCRSQCTSNEDFIIQITTIPTPNGIRCSNRITYIYLIVLLLIYNNRFFFSCINCDI